MCQDTSCHTLGHSDASSPPRKAMAFVNLFDATKIQYVSVITSIINLSNLSFLATPFPRVQEMHLELGIV